MPISFVVRVIPKTEREREDVTTMMFYGMTQQYQAERIKTATEMRRADAELGMLAADVSRLRRRLLRPARAMRRTSRRTRTAF